MILCSLLLLSLVEVHSQTVAPYLSFLGENLSNNSYVNFSLVGHMEDGSDNLQCHTQFQNCCRRVEDGGIANWFYPNGDQLAFHSGRVIHQTRTAQRVYLRTTGDTSVTGVYCCDIPYNSSVRETLCVGLYHNLGKFGTQSTNNTFYMWYRWMHRMGINYFVPYMTVLVVMMAVDSDLNGASPQFTLTCISTGGPATSVTWTRDSTTVTGGNETILNDSVIAQYTHTLTVTGRLPGLYTCTVRNKKQYIKSKPFVVQGMVVHTQ